MTLISSGQWARWGDPEKAVRLPEAVRDLLTTVLGVTPPAAPVDIVTIQLSQSGLPESVADALRVAVGAQHLHLDDQARLGHSAGKSTVDLLRQHRGEVVYAPDAVICPGNHDEVLAVLQLCSDHRVAVVPFGGGTSVVGGLTPRRAGFVAVAALELSRLNRLLAIDLTSRTVTLEAGLRGPEAEARLAEHGLSLGHVPQSFEYATIGGFAATRSCGQASTGYGRFDEMVVGLTVATPEGTIELGHAPASAAGPDLRQLFLGSEGALGVITSVTLRVRPTPASWHYEGWRFDSFDQGVAAVRAVAQHRHRPAILRLSDEVETAMSLARPDHLGASRDGGGCLMVVGTDDDDDGHVALLADAGGTPLGAAPGQEWADGRFAGPYLRDALLRAGAFAETLETATFWSGLMSLYETVRTAIWTALDLPALILCHISHLYPTGASLYFTVVFAQGDDPFGRWAKAKRAASEAIVAAGATITHHHGVGTDHQEWYPAEVGPLGMDVLRAVKQRLDPAGILNPGVLLSPVDR